MCHYCVQCAHWLPINQNKDANVLFWRGNDTDEELQRFWGLNGMSTSAFRRMRRTCFANQIGKPSSTAFYLDSNVSPHLLLAWPYCTCCVCQDEKRALQMNTNILLNGELSCWTCQDLNDCTCQNLFSLLLWLMTWPNPPGRQRLAKFLIWCEFLQSVQLLLIVTNFGQVSANAFCFRVEAFLSPEKKV